MREYAPSTSSIGMYAGIFSLCVASNCVVPLCAGKGIGAAPARLHSSHAVLRGRSMPGWKMLPRRSGRWSRGPCRRCAGVSSSTATSVFRWSRSTPAPPQGSARHRVGRSPSSPFDLPAGFSMELMMAMGSIAAIAEQLDFVLSEDCHLGEVPGVYQPCRFRD